MAADRFISAAPAESDCRITGVSDISPSRAGRLPLEEEVLPSFQPRPQITTPKDH